MILYAGIILLLCSCTACAAGTGSKDGQKSRSVRVQNITIDENNKIWIYDNALTSDEISSILELVSVSATDTRFVHRDFDFALNNGLTPFISVLNNTIMEKSTVYTVVRSAFRKSFEAKATLRGSYYELLHSLDPKPPVKQFCHKDVYYATIFLVNQWGHNMYGQLSFYTLSANKNITAAEREEIIHTVHPKPGRIVLWPSCVIHSAHPPSVNFFANLLTLRLVLTKSDAGNIEYDGLSLAHIEKPKFSGWTFNNADAGRVIDYSKCSKRNYFDSKKRGVHVFDDIFTPEELQQFRKILLDTATLRASVYDGSAMEDNDNVQWISSYQVEDFMTTPVWTRMQELLLYLTQEDEWYPYDVALNFIRPADHTRIHPDAEPHQVEYTFLLYLTENTTRTDFGETVFVEREKKSDGIHRFTNPGGEEYEPIAAVWPKYGRVAIFRNLVEHSARPFSTSHLSCRYTFACKVSRTKRLSLIKQIYEKMEIVNDGSKEFGKLNYDLSHGNHDDPSKSSLSTEQLQEKLDYIKSQARLQTIEYRNSIISEL